MLRRGYSPVTVDSPAPRPHERDWRHPSEISAEHRIVFAAEPPSRRLRTAAIVSGSVAVAAAVAVGAIIATAPAGPQVAQVRRAERPAATDPADVVAVPIRSGSGSVAAMTVTGMAVADALDGTTDGRADVTLHGGGRVEVRRIWSDQRIVIVATDTPAHSGAPPIAVYEPLATASDEVATLAVTLAGDHPPSLVEHLDRVAAFAEPLDGMDWSSVIEGTPVVDAEGNLVGLCSPHDSGVDLLAFSPDAIAATAVDR